MLAKGTSLAFICSGLLQRVTSQEGLELLGSLGNGRPWGSQEVHSIKHALQPSCPASCWSLVLMDNAVTIESIAVSGTTCKWDSLHDLNTSKGECFCSQKVLLHNRNCSIEDTCIYNLMSLIHVRKTLLVIFLGCWSCWTAA